MNGTIINNPKATKVTYGEEMYEALKEAVSHVCKRSMYMCDSIEFNDEEHTIYLLPTEEWFLIALGYETCKVLNNLPKDA